MKRFVIDASVAIKWVVEESDSSLAVAVLENCLLSAPDLLIAECANILWKKARRGDLTTDEAIAASRLLQQANIEILPTRHLMNGATALAIQLDHAAYDCIYLMLAIENNWSMITADHRLRAKVAESTDARLIGRALSMQQGVAAGKEAVLTFQHPREE